jgi:ectoine hydroxylase-related dioxygenase (phytanoyl-CoA dioxygenase family)
MSAVSFPALAVGHRGHSADDWAALGRELPGRMTDTGFCVLPDVLGARQVAAVRRRVLKQAAREAEAGLTSHIYDHGASQRVWLLVNKGQEFVDLIRSPAAVGFACAAFGADPLLSSAQANLVGPGGQPMALHAEQGFLPPPWPPYPMIVSAIWLLTDFTTENGATEVIPGSHLQQGDWLNHRDQLAEPTPIVAPAGSMVAMDGRLLHRSGANRSSGPHRCAIIVNYCQPFIRQQENIFLSGVPGLRDRADGLPARLLGYEPYAGYGKIKSSELEYERR